MPTSISSLRAFLTADAQDHPLPSPQPVNLAADVIPYGSTVRFEADLTADEPQVEMRAICFREDTVIGGSQMFPVGGTSTVRMEARLPWDMLWHPDPQGLTEIPRFPLDGWPVLAGGNYRLDLYPWTLAQAAARQWPSKSQVTFRLGTAPAPGGAAPRIVQLTGPPQGLVLLGQPWLAEATVEDADHDVLGVIFTVVRGGRGRGALLVDNGSRGDVQARDGIYSHARVGGDAWDQERMAAKVAQDVPITLAAQAVDLRGNWSEPAVVNYTLRYSQTPLWMAEPAPDAPAIEAAGHLRPMGSLDFRYVWARCSGAQAWVCARVMVYPDRVRALLDDGAGPDEVAGDGIYSLVYPFSPPVHLDVVIYAVPKTGPLRIGSRMAISVPPGP